MTAITLIRTRLAVRAAATLHAGVRYALAVALTLGANLSIVFLMQQGRTEKVIPLPENETIEMNVVDMEAEIPSELLPPEPQPMALPNDLPPEPQPLLPELDLADAANSESALKLPDIAGVPSLELCCSVPNVEPAPAPAVMVAAPQANGDTRGPMLIEPPDLASYYPYSARLRRIEGDSFVQIVVNPEGRVAHAKVLRSSPARVFDMAAQRLARSLIFRPARKNGTPVSARIQLNFHWELE